MTGTVYLNIFYVFGAETYVVQTTAANVENNCLYSY